MRITANRKEDLMKAKAELEAKKQQREEKARRQYDAYKEAFTEVTDGIEYVVNSGLNKFKLLNFEVRCSERFSDKLEVAVRCNERNKFEDTTALAWNFDVYLTRDGEIKKETGSWSGLQATTADQLASLEQTVEALKYLNSIDWKHMMDVEVPKYSDFVTYDNTPLNPEGIDYDYEIFVEELKDIVGTGTGIHGRMRSENGYGRQGYYFILDLKPKTVEVAFVSDYAVENYGVDEIKTQARWGENMRLSTLYPLISKPIETKEVW